MSDHDEGLITQYVHKVQALGVHAEAGEAVQAETRAVVTEAIEHFRIVKSSDPQANLLAFRGRLRIIAEASHSSQPAFKRTLEYAASICPAGI